MQFLDFRVDEGEFVVEGDGVDDRMILFDVLFDPVDLVRMGYICD
jgi:hypothetical protein